MMPKAIFFVGAGLLVTYAVFNQALRFRPGLTAQALWGYVIYLLGCIAWLFLGLWSKDLSSEAGTFLVLIAAIQSLSCLSIIGRELGSQQQNDQVAPIAHRAVAFTTGTILYLTLLEILLWSKLFFPNIDIPPPTGMQLFDPRDFENFWKSTATIAILFAMDGMLLPKSRFQATASMLLVGLKLQTVEQSKKPQTWQLLVRVIFRWLSLFIIFIPGPVLALLGLPFPLSALVLLMGFVLLYGWEQRVMSPLSKTKICIAHSARA